MFITVFFSDNIKAFKIMQGRKKRFKAEISNGRLIFVVPNAIT